MASSRFGERPMRERVDPVALTLSRALPCRYAELFASVARTRREGTSERGRELARQSVLDIAGLAVERSRSRDRHSGHNLEEVGGVARAPSPLP